MGEKKSKKTKAKKCKIKCCTCEFYDPAEDYCSEKDIKQCSKQMYTDFSTCENYLVKESLVMF